MRFRLVITAKTGVKEEKSQLTKGCSVSRCKFCNKCRVQVLISIWN